MNAVPHLADLQRTFHAPRGLGMSRPRAVALTRGGRVLAAAAVALFCAALAAGVLLTREARDQAARARALVDTGIVTTGQITRLWSDSDNRRRVVYSFAVDGVAYRGDRHVSRARRATLNVGAPIDVRYVPSDPRVNDLGGTPSGIPVAIPYAVPAAFTACAAICLTILHRQRQLLAEGRPAPAVVTGRKETSPGPHGKHWNMTYEFPLLNGTVATGKSSTSKRGPAVGSVLCVIYDPERPSRNRPYPFPLVHV
jgi:hypothetical protein